MHIARLSALILALPLVVGGCGPLDDGLQRGYELYISEMVFLGGGDSTDEQDLEGNAEIDVYECQLDADSNPFMLVYDNDAALTISVDQHVGFPNGLRIRITDVLVTYQQLDSLDPEEERFIQMDQALFQLQDGSQTFDLGEDEGLVTFGFEVPLIQINQFYEYFRRVDEELGISQQEQRNSRTGIYAFPRWRIRYDVFYEDHLGQNYSTSAEGVATIGDFVDDDCEGISILSALPSNTLN